MSSSPFLMGLMPFLLLKSAPFRHVRAFADGLQGCEDGKLALFMGRPRRPFDRGPCRPHVRLKTPPPTLRTILSTTAPWCRGTRAKADKISNASSQPQSSTPFASSRESNNSKSNRGPSCAATSSNHNCLSSSSPGRRGSQASPSHAARRHAATALSDRGLGRRLGRRDGVVRRGQTFGHGAPVAEQSN